MPGSIVHLKTAFELVEINGIDKSNLSNYLLGAIAPDSVNLNGHAPKDIRWRTHHRNKDIKVWYNMVVDFYNENKTRYDINFLKGYVVHLLTDILWDIQVNTLIHNVFREENVPIENQKSLRWQEITAYENTQINEDWFKTAVEQIRRGKAVAIDGMETEVIEGWRDNFLSKIKDKGNRPRIVTEKVYKDFLIKLVALCGFLSE